MAILPEDLAGLLRGFPNPEAREQAFPFLSVDEHGFPHSALLSRSELEPAADGSRLFGVVASPRTRANLHRSGAAGLIAVAGTVCHHAKLGMISCLEDGDLLGCVFELVEYKRDDIGIALTPMMFHASPELAERERWGRVADLLDRLMRRI
ncbi:hypothetical protein [Nocardia sp. NPDC059239]|uniref:hypothetical protein n=1 Tax=unclassified Nocardia TaxID=2637762 RepID=UPI0036826EEA